MKTADFITLIRLILLPFYVWSLQRGKILAVIMIGIIILTDLGDGWIARRLNQETDKGQIFDSVVDYLVINICFIRLFTLNVLSTHLFVYIMAGSFLLIVVHGVTWKTNRKFLILNSAVGKCRGTLEYALVLLLTLDWTVGPIPITRLLLSTTTLILVPLIFFHSLKMVHMATLLPRRNIPSTY